MFFVVPALRTGVSRNIAAAAIEVAAGMGEASHITAGDGIAFEIIGDNRHDSGSRSRRLDRGTSRRDNNIDAQLNELLRQSRKYFGPAACPARFDSDRLTFNVTGIAQALTQDSSAGDPVSAKPG